eukprot:748635-Hanusia_phi.AAC.1
MSEVYDLTPPDRRGDRPGTSSSRRRQHSDPPTTARSSNQPAERSSTSSIPAALPRHAAESLGSQNAAHYLS